MITVLVFKGYLFFVLYYIFMYDISLYGFDILDQFFKSTDLMWTECFGYQVKFDLDTDPTGCQNILFTYLLSKYA